MKKPTTPQDKKRLAYERDHYLLVEYPHTFRRMWPKKKRLENQSYRHQVRQALHTVVDSDSGEAAQSRTRAIRRPPFYPKWGMLKLRDRVEWRLLRRRERIGWNFFRRPYRSDRDREPFAAFLKALTS